MCRIHENCGILAEFHGENIETAFFHLLKLNGTADNTVSVWGCDLCTLPFPLKHYLKLRQCCVFECGKRVYNECLGFYFKDLNKINFFPSIHRSYGFSPG